MPQGIESLLKRVGIITTSLIAAILMLAANGCTSGTNDPAAAPEPLEQTAGGMKAVLLVDPSPPVAMKDTRLRLTLRDTSGQPVSGAAVRFDLSMPGMTMAPNKPDAVEAGSGAYQADTVLSMAGKWQVKANVTQGGTTTHFTFAFTVK